MSFFPPARTPAFSADSAPAPKGFEHSTWFGDLLVDSNTPVARGSIAQPPLPAAQRRSLARLQTDLPADVMATQHRQRRLAEYAGKRVLLLQGPMGPFFRQLANELRGIGATVFKINFNAGDWWFYRDNAEAFRGSFEEWPAFVRSFITGHQIDAVMLFGDCRPIHDMACRIAVQLQCDVRVFEEGYIRPCYMTMDRFGVNGWTSLPDSSGFYAALPAKGLHIPLSLGPVFGATARCAVQYALAFQLGRRWFPAYQHHRPLGLGEAKAWALAWLRKWQYRWQERGAMALLQGPLRKRYFLVPLQVATDSQIQFHSRFDNVAQFIEEVVASFAAHAGDGDHLVIKHHPLDRGHHDYRALLAGLSARHGLGGRLLYIHDQALPALLKGAAGVVVINSTVGMSALHFGAAVKVMGSAVYNMRGLTYQGQLHGFWSAARSFQPDKLLFRKFRNYLIEHTQLVGSFYKPLPGAVGARAG